MHNYLERALECNIDTIADSMTILLNAPRRQGTARDCAGGCALRFMLSKPFPAECALSLCSLVCSGLISCRVSRTGPLTVKQVELIWYVLELRWVATRTGKVPIEIIIRLKVCFHREMGFWRCTLWNERRARRFVRCASSLFFSSLLFLALTELRAERKGCASTQLSDLMDISMRERKIAGVCRALSRDAVKLRYTYRTRAYHANHLFLLHLS